VQASADPNAMLSAPVFRPMPTINPYAMQMAAINAMKAAGWSVTTPSPPKVYFPVILYRGPGDYLPFTTPMPLPTFVQEDEEARPRKLLRSQTL
jgi:hypothetical protein